MDKQQKLGILGRTLLLLATLAWGSSFVILKSTINDVPPMFVIGLRFFFAGAVLLLVFIKRLKTLSKTTFLAGVIIGITVTIAYLTQTYGLKYTTPGKNAFLTASYCVMCPFLSFLLFKQRIKLKNLISAVLCVLGIGLISLTKEENVTTSLLGEGLTLVSAVFFALQIVFISFYHKKGADSMLTLVFMFLTAGILQLLISFTFELSHVGIGAYKLNGEELLKIGYLAVVCTLFAQSAQLIGQKYTPSNQSALILSLEAVFGMLFSVILKEEELTLLIGLGFVVVFISILISEIDISTIINKISKNTKKAVIFDLDGTIIDTAEDIKDAMNFMLSKYGFETISVERMKECLGGDRQEIVRLSIGREISEELLNECAEVYAQKYIDSKSPKTKVFDGISEVIYELKKRGYYIIVLSNKPQVEMGPLNEKLLGKLNLDELVGLREDILPKPNPQGALNLLKKYNVDPKNAYFIGDGETDILTGINANITPIAVLWGNRNREFLSKIGAEIFAEKPEDLLEIIK